MGKHRKEQKKQSPTPVQTQEKVEPQPPVAEVVETPDTNVIQPTSLPEGEVWNAIKSSLNNLPPDLRAQAEKQLEKIRADAERNMSAKKFGAFNTELEKELPVFIANLAKKHEVSIAGRKISIAYPTDGGAPKASHTPIGAKTGNGGNGHGFPGSWGKAQLVDKEGKASGYESPGALANALHLQIQGMRNMVDVFENPKRAVTKEELPKVYKVDAVRGDHFIVKVVA